MGQRANQIESLDWSKVEEEPSKRYKIQGHFLLDLRAKRDYLKEKLKMAEEKISDLKHENNSITRENEEKQATNKKTIEEKEGLIRGLKLQNEDLEIELEKKEKRINELSHLYKERESKLSSVETELKAAYNEISDLTNTLNKITYDINSRDEEISELSLSIKELREVKDKLNLELIERTKLLAKKNNKIKKLKKQCDEEKERQSKYIQELEAKIDELTPFDLDQFTHLDETRIRCPRCDSVGKDIKTVDDKSKVIYYDGPKPIYAKKHVCKICSYEWS